MTSTNGKAHCNYCNSILITQKNRIDVYKRKLGTLKIYMHFCPECFNTIADEVINRKKKSVRYNY